MHQSNTPQATFQEASVTMPVSPAHADVGVARRGPRRMPPVLPAGLSTAHISPQRPYISGEATFYIGGSLIQVKKPRPKLRQVGGGRRGKISLYSFDSRRRMQHKLGMVDHSGIPLFMTITYPGDWWPTSPATWKKHFDMLDKRMARRWPGSALFWKLEPQERGAPHFHCLVWGILPSELRDWLPEAWNEVVYTSRIPSVLRDAVQLYRKLQRVAGSAAAAAAVEAAGQDVGRVHHILAGTSVEIVRSWRGVRSYAAKYMGKVIDGSIWENPGRWWGVRRSDNIPWATALTCNPSHPEVCKLMRLMRRYAHLKGRDYSSLSILVTEAEFWFDRLDRLLPARGNLESLLCEPGAKSL